MIINHHYLHLQQENPFASERLTKRDKLPKDRSVKYDDDFIIEKSSEGYLTVQQLLEIFTKRRESPSEWNSETIAKQYKIEQNDAENLLKYFNNYKVLVSRKPDTPLQYHLLHR